jgi:hypothetical protein
MSRKISRKSQKKVNRRRSHRSKKTRRHRGGSQASDLVMDYAKSSGLSLPALSDLKLPGNPSALNLYQTTGGGCGCNKNVKGGSKSKRGGSPASEYVMQRAQYVLDETNRLGGSQKGGKKMNKRGGSATDFRDTLYSRIYNGDRTDAVPFFNAFTNEQHISQQDLANEPNVVPNPPYLQ